MNKQLKKKKGVPVSRGIEWTDYTWNPVAGCLHGCRWRMPDDSSAICYAENTAEGTASAFYPKGFAHHYWNPDRLEEPLRVRKPSKIFLDSMSDLMGAWVPDEQIEAVLDVCRRATWHTFQLLTKNAPRLLKFSFPKNVWVGASTPPDFMFNRILKRHHRERMLHRTLDVLADVEVPVNWVSVEPLSWDVSEVFKAHLPVSWVVIGAASNGRTIYQPDISFVRGLLTVLDKQGVKVFFKGNLKWSPWREEFPEA